MFRAIFTGLRSLQPILQGSNGIVSNLLIRKVSLPHAAAYSGCISPTLFSLNTLPYKCTLLKTTSLVNSKYNIPNIQPGVRSLTKFSLRKGKRKSVKAVLKRFYRLDWGIWIRTKAGRQKRLWSKTAARKRRLRQHVFCNATQTTLLDKMVTRFWKKRRFYIDDPYEPYHKREEFPITRKQPI